MLSHLFLMSLPTTQSLVIRKSLIVYNQPVPSKIIRSEGFITSTYKFYYPGRGEPFTPPALMHSSDTSYTEADYPPRNTYLCVSVAYREQRIAFSLCLSFINDQNN